MTLFAVLHPPDSHPRPDLSDILHENLGHFPKIPSPVSCQTTPTLKDALFLLLFFYISSLSLLFFFLSVSPFSFPDCYICPCAQLSDPTDQKKEKRIAIIFQHLPWCFNCRQAEFWANAFVSCRASWCSSRVAIATLRFCFVLFPPGCVHSSPCTAAIVAARCRWVKTCTLSGQLIMDFDYSHFVSVSAVPPPTGGPVERPAPLIVSVSGLIEPNGNGSCQSSLFSSVYMLIHQRDIHYRLTENSSRHAHTQRHTHTLTFCRHVDKGLKLSEICTYSCACRCYWEWMLFSDGARVYITEPLLSVSLPLWNITFLLFNQHQVYSCMQVSLV